MQSSRSRSSLWFGFAIVLVVSGTTGASSLRLPQIFGDHMVLQRDLPVEIWGWAAPGQSVEVAFSGKIKSAQADSQGQWHLQLDPLTASKKPRVLTIRAGQELVDFNDILVGDVWLCSGQSNMYWLLEKSENPEAAVAAADFPLIRHVQTDKVTSPVPLDDVKLQHRWELCSPNTASYFTAVGYYFARVLHKELDVPIGLVNSSWGGSNIESFTSLEGFKAIPALKDIVARVEATLPNHSNYETQIRDIVNQVKAWVPEAETALAQNQRVPVLPIFPPSALPLTEWQHPTVKFNAMIKGLVPFRMRGVIWYQGESNHREGQLYVTKTRALLKSWRQAWQQPDLPYYYVQIAPYQYGQEPSHILPTFWEAQAAIEKEIPHTHMVVINDVADLKDIHPRDKKTVGSRLAAQALNHTYGRTRVSQGPAFERMAITGDTLTVSFTHTGSGLTTRDGKAPTWFEIAGEDGIFYAALARIQGDTVVLKAKNVIKPKAMRFAWHKLAEPNLRNKEGFPVSAFRAGKISERGLVDATVPQARDYKLVYSYEVGAEGTNAKNIVYRVDNAEATSKFTRVAYFLALQKGESPLQWVWVSMDPFTQKANQLGLPLAAQKTRFRKWVTHMEVISNVTGVETGKGLKGYLEIWPSNYGKENTGKVPGASDTAFDFGDTPANNQAGYGCLQIHHPDAKQTILAVNHWTTGEKADVGIGNSPQGEPDWTFRANAGEYKLKRLMVMVKPR